MAASASTAALKTLLDTLVYTNTSNAISGDGLNVALDDIIDTLDSLKAEYLVAVYGSTSLAAVLAAINAEKYVVAYDPTEGEMYMLSTVSQNGVSFCSNSSTTITEVVVRSGGWSKTTTTPYVKPSGGIPATDLASGVIPAPEIFWATYGSTTYAAIAEAYNAGKLVAVLVNGQYVEILSRVQETSITFSTQIGTYLYRAAVSSSDVWSNNIFENEVASNKVTSLSSSSTDTQYPSAKCVYDLIGDVETLLAAI